MGNCSSDESQKRPQGDRGAPQRRQSNPNGPKRTRVSTGFGAPVARDDFGGTATGVPDMDMYNTLPPCPVAQEVKGLHSKFGGKPQGVEWLTQLYVAVRALRDLGKEIESVRFLSLDAIGRDPNAIRVANYAGFVTDVADVSRLTAEEHGRYARRRSSTELDTLMQYLSAMLGGEPETPAHLQIHLD